MNVNEESTTTDCLFELHGINKKESTFKFCGMSLNESINIAEFYLFMLERMHVAEKWRKMERPYSNSLIFQEKSFCHVYREMDRGTKFLRSIILTQFESNKNNWTSKLDWITNVLWISYVYRQINRIESFIKIGFIPSLDFNTSHKEQLQSLKQFLDKVDEFKKRGQTFFTGAHQTTNVDTLKMNLQNTIIDKKMNQVAHMILEVYNDRKEHCERVAQALKTLDGIGSFLTWQIMCDLQESNCLVLDEKFVILGPGAKSGLDLIFPKRKAANADKNANELVRIQDEVMDALTPGEKFPYWRGKRLSLKEIEHSLCEFSKYKSLMTGNTYGRNYNSREHLDTNQECFCCKKDKDEGLFCETCNTFLCTSCDPTATSTSSNNATWICQRCNEYEKITWPLKGALERNGSAAKAPKSASTVKTASASTTAKSLISASAVKTAKRPHPAQKSESVKKPRKALPPQKKSAVPAPPACQQRQSPSAAAVAAAGPIMPPTVQSLREQPNSYIEQRVAKFFGGILYFGSVKSYNNNEKLWYILYDDSDDEDYDANEMIMFGKEYEMHKHADPKLNQRR